MILLGAGASKVFGLPTMQDLTFDLIKLMETYGQKDLMNEIIRGITRFGLKPDFENIYSTLEALANYQDFIINNGVTAYFANKADFNGTNNERVFTDILLEMRNLVHEKCKSPNLNIENQNIIDKLIKVCRQGEVRLYPATGGQGQIHIADAGKQTFVTTNYDTIIELYHNVKGIKLATGFNQEGRKLWAPFDLNDYYRNYNANWLIKLHGSIWQFKKANGDIIQTDIDPSNIPYVDFTIKENLMIYPVGQKPILENPYYWVYNLFRSQPWIALTAIGYSFRDYAINIAILERMKTHSKSKLIIVNKNAEEALMNLAPPPEIKDRIIRINLPFDNNDILFDKIYTAMGCNNWLEYQKHSS
jgi:hypothetical protein